MNALCEILLRFKFQCQNSRSPISLSPRVCSTPNPFHLEPRPNVAPLEAPRFASSPNPHQDLEPNPGPSIAVVHATQSQSPTFEELVVLVKNIKKLSRDRQDNLLNYIRKLERENPNLVRRIQNAIAE